MVDEKTCDVFLIPDAGKTKQWKQITRFRSLRKKMSPDVTSYGAVASSCEKDAEWQLSLHLLRRWQSEKTGSAVDIRMFFLELFQN